MANSIEMLTTSNVAQMKELITELHRIGAESGGKYHSVMVWGAPGGGKSEGILQVADERALALTGQAAVVNPTVAQARAGELRGRFVYLDVRLNLLNPVDLKGLPTVDDGGSTRWARPDFLLTEDCGIAGGIMCLEELPTAARETQSPAYQLVLDGRVGEHRLPNGLMVVATGNRATDKGVFNAFGKALKNRFVHVELLPNVDEWVPWALNHGVDHRICDFLDFMPSLLSKVEDGQTGNGMPTPRTWRLASDVLKIKNAEIRKRGLTGAIGEYAATEFGAFLDIYSKLPDLDKIMKGQYKGPDPKTMKKNVLFALQGALFQKLEPQNAEHWMTFIGMCPEEIVIVATRNALKHGKKFLVDAPGFRQWILKYRKMLI